MTIPPDDISAAFRLPESDGIGLELSIDLGGEAPMIGELSTGLHRIRECQLQVTVLAKVIKWLEDDEPVPKSMRWSFDALDEAARFGDRGSVALALAGLASELRLTLAFAAEDRFEPRFEFVGAYRVNPLVLRFDIRGGRQAMLAFVLVFGAVHLKKEFGAEACREQSAEIARHQMDSLAAIARLQGRWTPELRESHRVIVETARASAAACGSPLRGFGVGLHNPRGLDFDVRLDVSGPAPKP